MERIDQLKEIPLATRPISKINLLIEKNILH
jgi:hypothetical protein